jgi:hypothetical protein
VMSLNEARTFYRMFVLYIVEETVYGLLTDTDIV